MSGWQKWKVRQDMATVINWQDLRSMVGARLRMTIEGEE